MIGKVMILALALVVPALGHSLPYIIGGNTVSSATKYPWQGSVQIPQGSYRCGCVLLSANWAVIAAHCLGAMASDHRLRFGSLLHASGGQYRTPTLVIRHESYGTGSGRLPNDIAVLKFAAVSLSSTVKPIVMASTEQAGNPDCYITGWGYTYINGGSGIISRELQEAKIDVYTTDICKHSWTGAFSSGHVCIGDVDAGRGVCNGDDGGPLVCKVGGSYQLVGVLSFFFSDCRTIIPSVYTRISFFRNWVTSTINAN